MLALRIKKAVRNGATLVVADPRAIWLTKLAKRHLQLRPGSDVWLLNAIMHVILEEGLQDDDYIAAHCEDFDAVREVVSRYTPEDAERVTGVSAEAIRATAREYATERHAAIFYTLGITEHACGVDNIWSLANLVLMTGHLGYESTGLNALRGQNNVQGLNDSGANPHYFPGYQSWDDPDVREKFATAWGVDLPERAGYRLDQMMSGLHDGRIKALYLVGENPAQTEPNAHHVEEGLRQLEFLVAQDLFLNETSRRHANVVFPASSFAEKDGTFTNTERRINRVRAAVPLPGNARGDREIVIALARALGCDWPDYPDAESVWNELADLCPNWFGIRYPRIEEHGMQWPCPSEDHPGTMFLHEGHPSLPSGKGKFHPVEYQPPIEEPDSEYPFVLSTGRTLYHYNSATMTMREDGITDKQVEPFFEIAAEDASALGVAEGEWVRLVSRRGDLTARAQLSDRVYPGPRLDGAPFRRGARELADTRRRRPADRHARVQGLGRAAGARLTPLSPELVEAAAARPPGKAVPLSPADGDDAADARRRATRGRRRRRGGADRRPRADGPPLGGAVRLVAPRLDAAAAAAGEPRGRVDARRRRLRRRRDRTGDGPRRTDQVAERRHAQPAQGRGLSRRAQGRRRRPRDRGQRQPAPGGAPGRGEGAGRLAAVDHGSRVRPRTDPRRPAARAGAALRRVARRRPRRAVRGSRCA